MMAQELSIEAMARPENKKAWPMLRDLIRSGQVPWERVWEIMRECHEFTDWYRDSVKDGYVERPNRLKSAEVIQLRPNREQEITAADAERALGQAGAILVKAVGPDKAVEALVDFAARIREQTRS